MEKRPPLSRPKTSSGSRPGTAFRRPKTAGKSRVPISLGNKEDSELSITYSSRAAERPDSSQLFKNIISENPRIGTAGFAKRPASGSIRTPSRGNIVLMPPGTAQQKHQITQQGVQSAQRSFSRLGTAFGSRQVADKTYYIALLNGHLKLLEDEIESLNKEIEKTEKGQQNLLFYEQRAEEQASELKQLQSELANLNMIIDLQNTNSDLRNMEFELAEEEKINQNLILISENLFRERQEKEDLIAELEVKIAKAQRENADQINNLDSEVKEELEEIKLENETIRQQLAEQQRVLNDLKKSKEELDLALSNSPLKQQAMVFEEQIRELEDKKEIILKELNSNGNPEKQRQHFIQKIQKDNEEVALMEVQLQEMNERISQAQEELREFYNEVELLNSDKNEKFRNLKHRDAYIESFLNDFDRVYGEMDLRIQSLSKDTVKLLQLISINCRHVESGVNITSLDESMLNNNLKNTKANATELQDLHVRLQEEIISLNLNIPQLKNELEELRQKQIAIETNKAEIEKRDLLHKEMENKNRELQARSVQLRKEILVEETENEKLRIEVENVDSLLANSLHYNKLKELKRRVEVVEKERILLTDQINDLIVKNDYQDLKQDALRLRFEYNTILMQTSR